MFDRLAAASGDVSLAMTLRSAIALTAAIGGAGLGLLLARKVAATGRPARPARGRGAEAKRPISALEELGPEGFDEPFADDVPRAPSPEPIPGRRRPLSVTDETRPSEFLAHAPLPGEVEALDIIDYQPAYEEDALELGDFEQDAHGAFDPPPIPPAADKLFGSAALSDAVGDDTFGEPAPLPRQTILRQVREAIDQPAAAPFAAPTAGPAPRASFGMPQPVAAPIPVPMAEEEPAPVQMHVPPASPAPVASARPLAELGMAELVERFALSLQRAGHPVAAAHCAQATSARDDNAEQAPEMATFAAEPAPAPFVPPAATIPAALRPIAFGDDIHEDGDDEFGFAMPTGIAPAPFAQPAAPFTSIDDSDQDDEEDGFASLLEMRSKLGDVREAVRVEDEHVPTDFEPVVTFPGVEARRAFPAPDGPSRDAGFAAQHDFSRPAPFAMPQPRASDPAATEAALRDALTKLQRISGAA